MRLLQLTDRDGLAITENLVKKVPPYAILSHRWLADEDEVTFKDVKKGLGRNKEGYKKIISCGKQARRNGLLYFWVDTCCIDKRSSAELSEAINSMFQWYRQAVICYAYLSDVDHPQEITTSSWFKRGWTLQELLAPPVLWFYSRDWTFLSAKRSILTELEASTLIPQDALSDFQSPNHSVAQKMSWSARRATTREEDLAYCLMGLFDVNIPLIYGEGSKAFIRLQQAIMDQNTDLSLFLWSGLACDNVGMLAAAPSCFEIKSPLRSLDLCKAYNHSRGWARNNAGISLRLPVRPFYIDTDEQVVFTAVVYNQFRDQADALGIFLKRIGSHLRKGQYTRIAVDGKTCIKLSQLDLPHLFQYRTLATDLQILNEPMTHSSSAGNHMFTIWWQCPPNTEVRTYQRPESNANASFRDWPIVAVERTGISKICFEFRRTSIHGIFAFLSITCPTAPPLIIWLGFDTFLRPISLVMVSLLDYKDYWARDIFDAYFDLHDFDDDREKVFDIPTGVNTLKAVQGSIASAMYSDTLWLSMNLSVLELKISTEFWKSEDWFETRPEQIRVNQEKLFPMPA